MTRRVWKSISFFYFIHKYAVAWVAIVERQGKDRTELTLSIALFLFRAEVNKLRFSWRLQQIDRARLPISGARNISCRLYSIDHKRSRGGEKYIKICINLNSFSDIVLWNNLWVLCAKENLLIALCLGFYCWGLMVIGPLTTLPPLLSHQCDVIQEPLHFYCTNNIDLD